MLDKMSGCPSDHRTFIIDVDTAGLWRAPLHHTPSPTPRGFTSANKPRTTTYINRLHDLLTASDFDQIIEQAHHAIANNETESILRTKLERADNIMTSCMLQAERSIMPSKRACSHPWSPALIAAQRKKGLVSNLLSVMNNNIPICHRIEHRFLRNARAIDPTWELPSITFSNIQRLAHDTTKEAKKALHQAQLLRRQHLDDLRSQQLDSVTSAGREEALCYDG